MRMQIFENKSRGWGSQTNSNSAAWPVAVRNSSTYFCTAEPISSFFSDGGPASPNGSEKTRDQFRQPERE
jgi:hypothetical protein